MANNEMALSHADKANQSSDKLLKIIELMSQHSVPISLPDLALLTEMNISTTRRFLVTLLANNYIAKDAKGNYFLTLKICHIANRVKIVMDLKEVCVRFLQELCREFSETVNLGVEDEGELLYLDSLEPKNQYIKLSQSLGTAPLYCTAMGKLFLSDYSDAAFNEYCASKTLDFRTEHTITSPAALREECKKIKGADCAFDNEEYEIGARCIAAPIRNYNGKIIAGISISGLASRLSDEVIAKKLPILQSACKEISNIFGAG